MLYSIFTRPFRRIRNSVRTKKERGYTLIEIMAALAVAALLAAGGVFVFNTASERAEGNTIMQGMQPFMVDINNYLSIHYSDDILGNEALLSGSTSNKKDWDEGNNVAVLTPALGDLNTSALCTSWGGTWGSNTCTGTLNGNPNQNLSRFVNLSSIRHYEGSDPDGRDEWSLVLTDDKQLDIAFRLTPEPSVTLASTTAVTPDNVHSVLGCAATDDTSIPDVSLNMLVAIEDIDVCQTVANGLLGYDSVQQVQCYDTDTFHTWSPPATPVAVDGDSVLGICFNVKQ